MDVRDGDVLDLNELPQNLNMRVVTDPAEVTNVIFYIDGVENSNDSVSPYALKEDNNGNYQPEAKLKRSGSTYTIEAAPFIDGTEGSPGVITISIVDSGRNDNANNSNGNGNANNGNSNGRGRGRDDVLRLNNRVNV